MDITLQVDQEVHLKIAPVDANGVSRLVQDITWSNVGDGVLTPDADGLGATLVPSDTPGLNVVTVSADADLTTGVAELTSVANITSTALPIPQATDLGLTADAATPKA